VGTQKVRIAFYSQEKELLVPHATEGPWGPNHSTVLYANERLFAPIIGLLLGHYRKCFPLTSVIMAARAH
jgi:hypothetical protein